ncbi:MAG: hypothetical protein FWE90_04730 [Defluviitaleaceae bacterium]|nr:hypothetical protein [Defluviitaleaceae bacterium]
MSTREYIRTQVDLLPDNILEKVQDFIGYQKFILGIYDTDTDYLSSIPGMVESIKAAAAEPLDDCVPVTELWSDV